jgi:hypothetical protein
LNEQIYINEDKTNRIITSVVIGATAK